MSDKPQLNDRIIIENSRKTCSKLEIKGLYKIYDRKTVLDDINLDVRDGEFLSILGVSGSGKSTLLKSICGIKRPDYGKVYLNGKDITDMPMNKRDIVIVHQDALLFPHMSVAENIGFSLRMRKIRKDRIKERTDELLKIIELQGYQDKNVSEISGGERQRVALARAVAAKPEVLLLDEPFNGLDANLRMRMREFTKNLVTGEKITTILVTHDKEEAFMLSDRVAIMEKGRLSAIDEPHKLYRDPGTLSAARFLGYENFEDEDELIKVIPSDSIMMEISDRGDFIITGKAFKGSRTRYELKKIDEPDRVLICETKKEDLSVSDRVKIWYDDAVAFHVKNDRI